MNGEIARIPWYARAAPLSACAAVALFVLLSRGLRNLALMAGGEFAMKERIEEIACRRKPARTTEKETRRVSPWSGFRGVLVGVRAGRWGFGGLGRLMGRVVRESPIDSGLVTALERAGANLKAGEFLAVCAVSGVLAAAPGLAWRGPAGALVLGLLGPLAPVLWLRRRGVARTKQFNGQLADGLTMVANSLRSGYSFLQSLDLVAREMAGPVSEEFGRVVREAGLNVPIEESLSALLKRVRSDDLDLMVTAVLIQREVGGNLAEVLDKISHTIRERARILGEVRTLTAQGRMSGLIVGLLPLALCVILTLMNRAYMEPFFRHPLGRAMLAAAVVMQVTGMVLVRRIVNIRV